MCLLRNAKLTRRRLKHGVFYSVVDLQAAINRFIAEHILERYDRPDDGSSAVPQTTPSKCSNNSLRAAVRNLS
jgi:hypothetical protein